MIQFKVFLGESFSVTATGRDKWDRMLANPGINSEVKMMTPDAAMRLWQRVRELQLQRQLHVE
jgi:hypothetical protein